MNKKTFTDGWEQNTQVVIYVFLCELTGVAKSHYLYFFPFVYFLYFILTLFCYQPLDLIKELLYMLSFCKPQKKKKEKKTK